MKRASLSSKFCLIVLLGTFFAGCNAPQSHLMTFNKYFNSSNFEKSIEFAQSKISKSKKPKGEDLLWALQLGSLERLKQNHRESAEYFDKSEEMLNFYDYQNELVDSLASTVVSDNIVPYAGEEYDGVMVNTYKALNFMTMGEDDLARVEFNRALDRQRRAKEKFAQEINKLKNEIEKEQNKGKSQVKENVENPEINTIISQKYPGLSEFEAYPDFVNPFTTYIAGVYFNLAGDHSKAVDLLKESYGMVQNNQYIAEDLAVTEKILDSQQGLENTVWVIFENGLGPIKEEFRIDIPLFVVTRKVRYVGIALPKLAFRQQAYPYLLIKAAGNNYKTQLIADLDRVIQTEFSKDFKAILTRAIISATAKAITQYVLEEEGSYEASIASILVSAYSFATTAADVRIWTTLPKDFQVARFQIPEDRALTIEPPGGTPFEVKIPACKNAIIYVRIPFKEAIVVYDLITY